MGRYQSKLGIRPLFAECSERTLDEFERERGMPLPEDYRHFLLHWNGCRFQGVPAYDLLDPNFEGEYGTVDMFYGLGPEGKEADLRTSGFGYEFVDRVPERFLAIGRNPYQESVCISLADDDCGHVFLWSPGEPWELDGNVQTTQYLYLAARSFREFYDGLYENPKPMYR